MRNRAFIANLDMYRKVPVDLLEGTRRGSILSTIAVITMTTLFLLETKAFFTSTLKTNLALDSNQDPQIRVNFNITMMDLKCDYATIDVVSVLGRGLESGPNQGLEVLPSGANDHIDQRFTLIQEG